LTCKLCKGTGRYRGVSGSTQLCTCPVGVEIFEAQRRDCNVPVNTRPLEIALAVRRNIDQYVIQHPNTYNRSMKDLCAFASMALGFAFEKRNIKYLLCSGVYKWMGHVWVVWNTKIIDLTFTQFERTASRVMVFNETDSRFRALVTFDDMQAVIAAGHGGGPVSVIKRMAKL